MARKPAPAPPRGVQVGKTVGVVVLCFLAAAAVVAVGPLLDLRMVAYSVAAVLVAGSIGWGVVTDRAQRRGEVVAAARESLLPMVGSRSRLVAARWSGGWVGTPGKVKLRYDGATADPDEPGWEGKVLAAVAADLGVKYRVVDRQRRRHLLVLRKLSGDSSEGQEEPASLTRLRTYVTQLMGPTAKAVKVDFDDEGEICRFVVTHSAGAKLAAVGYQRRVEAVIGSILPGRWRAKWDTQADEVLFEVRPTFPARIDPPVKEITNPEQMLTDYDEVTIALGRDENGKELVWQPAVDPNLMVVGAPGTGKTSLMHGVVAQVAKNGWPVWIGDGKGIEFLGFRGWPNVQVVAGSVSEQVALLHRAKEVADYRYDLIRQGVATETDFEPLLVVFDEWANFRGNLQLWYQGVKEKGMPSVPPCVGATGSIGRLGRSGRVHLLFATQRPDAEYFQGDMRDNFRMRVSMGRLSPQGAQMMWESPSVGVHLPRGRRGRATAIDPQNRPVEVQMYYTPDPRRAKGEDQKLLDTLRPPQIDHERYLILPPTPQTHVVDEDSGMTEELPSTYSDYANTSWVPAREAPDQDPLNAAAGVKVDPSPTALFRRLDRSTQPGANEGSSTVSAPVEVTDAPTLTLVKPQDEEDEVGDEDSGDGYQIAQSYAPSEIEPGWLVLVDADTDQWGVVEHDPEPDPFDEDLISISWRGDDDEAGVLVAEDHLTARAPG